MASEDDLTIKGPILAPFEFTDFTPYPNSLADRLETLASLAKQNGRTVYHYFLARQIGSPILLGLVLLGLFRQPWSNRRLGHEVLLLIIAGSIAIIVLTSAAGEFRYFFPIVPLLLLWSGKGIDELAHWLMSWELLRNGRLFRPRLIAGTLQLCVIALMMMVSSRSIQQDWFFAVGSSSALAARDAGLWLARYAPGPKRIAVRAAVIPYYAKGTLIGLPYGDPVATRRYVAKKNVDFVVLESEHSQELPTVGEWIAHGVPDPHARLVYDRTNAAGDRVVIYQWLRDQHL